MGFLHLEFKILITTTVLAVRLQKRHILNKHSLQQKPPVIVATLKSRRLIK